MRSIIVHPNRFALLVGTVVSAAFLSGCSPELASFDDTYVPASVEENFPIKIVEQPVKLTVAIGPSGLISGEAYEVVRFSREVMVASSSPVTISYSTVSKSGPRAADQVAAILIQQGIPRHAINKNSHGKEDVLTIVASVKTATTKPCGSWAENLRANQNNQSGTAFGCSVQQNMAAMVARPGDFERARPMPPSLSVSQNPALSNYGSGAWTTPTASSDF